VGGANTTSLSAAHFAKRNTKFGGGGKKLESESEGGQKFLPPNLFRHSLARTDGIFGGDPNRLH